ncbi:MAG TPA: pyridoxamine 5'-phosphate oxidase family protein [Nitrospirae bacterium]|nr:pyridoxamine 5'-phosphate oxidase family protein [Nitrospirota bacterium]
MRKSKKEIQNRDIIIELLNSCHAGRLGTISKDGYPMVKPLNFVYHDGKLYFHSAKEGEKIDDIKRDSRVCFEVDQLLAYVKAKNQPCEAGYLYRSVIIKGKAHIIEDREEKLFALRCLMEKYQPQGNYGGFLEKKLVLIVVVRIDIEEMTGKEDLGKGSHKDAVLKGLREGSTVTHSS